MAKLAVLEISTGSFATGFAVKLQVGDEGAPCSIALSGQLPPAPEVLHHYESWQLGYRSRGKGFRWKTVVKLVKRQFNLSPSSQSQFRQLKAVPSSTRQRSNLKVLASELEKALNQWLDSGNRTFQKIRDQLLKTFSTPEPVRLIIQTDQLELWQLPWELWHLVQEHSNVGVALSKREYAPVQSVPPTRSTVRILALLGDSTDINIQADLELLQQHLPTEAEIYAPKQVERSQLSDDLWTQSWDILFFAGHSSSQAGEGKLYLTADTYLTIPDLKYALSHAIAHGLKLAIFNSCDGLDLARDLADLQLPATIVMREPVPDEAAQKFLSYFLKAFAWDGQSLYAAVRQARQRLQGLEDKYPCVSWLPVISQNPAAPVLEWRSFLPVCPLPDLSAPVPPPPLPVGRPKRNRLKARSVFLISLVVTCLVMGVRSLGWLETAELWAYDRLIQWQSSSESNAKILIVGITDGDIQTFGQPLSDRIIHKLLTQLEQDQPAVIGLDIFRPDSTPDRTKPDSARDDWQDLTKFLGKSDRTIAICEVGEVDGGTSKKPPPLLPKQRIGFSDGLQFDPDGAIRRYTLAMGLREKSTCQSEYSLGLQVVQSFFRGEAEHLGSRHLLQLRVPDRPLVEIKDLEPSSGGYNRSESEFVGSQILIRYSSKPIPQLSLGDVLQSSQEELRQRVRGKVVWIGYVGEKTYPNEIQVTPIGKLSGVNIHAQVVSQLMQQVEGGRALRSATQQEAFLWVGLWVGLAGGLVQVCWGRTLYFTQALGLFLLLLVSYVWFVYAIVWLPIVAAGLAFITTSLLANGWRWQTFKLNRNSGEL